MARPDLPCAGALSPAYAATAVASRTPAHPVTRTSIVTHLSAQRYWRSAAARSAGRLERLVGRVPSAITHRSCAYVSPEPLGAADKWTSSPCRGRLPLRAAGQRQGM